MIELLLEDRSIWQEVNRVNQMYCVLNLLGVFKVVICKLQSFKPTLCTDIYARHLKLYDLNIDYKNWAEAGFTLQKLAAMLRWTDEPINPRLHNINHPKSVLHRNFQVVLSHCFWLDMIINLLQVVLYRQIELLSEGQMWEQVLEHCRAQVLQFEE